MPAPLALAVPAAAAGLAYLNAKLSVSYDCRLISSALTAEYKISRNEKNDKLNSFYVLEEHALGARANHPFIVFQGKQWTYKETYDITLQYGAWLKTEHHVQPKEIVVVDFVNSEKLLFLQLGLWSIGAKPALLNYNLTGKGLAHCIRISTGRLVLVDPEVEHNVTQDVKDELNGVEFQTFSPHVEAIVRSTTGLRAPNSDRSEDKASNIGCLIYTSGTTGLPKAAIVSWRKINLGSYVVGSFCGVRTDDVFYTPMPLYHSSANTLGFCTSLYTGCTVVIGKKFSTKAFWREARETKSTVIQYVGETCRYLLTAPSQIDAITGENIDRKNNVRLAFGNGLRPDIWNRFKERFDIQEISEFYSATESSSASWNYSRNDFSKGAIGRGGLIAWLIGRNKWAIVDLDHDTEQPFRDPSTGFCKRVPMGAAGEMLYALDAADIGKLFQGYFNQEKSTNSKIMRDVFVKGDAYFRTGDLISWDGERTFFNDRIGDTFRWKSENVSTNEVAEALGTHPIVQEANVYGVSLPHHDGRAGCVALVLGQEPDAAALQDLASHVKTKLPKYAVPLFLRVIKGQMEITGTNKFQKVKVRDEGVDHSKVGDDRLFWMKDGTYVEFERRDWEDMNGGRVKL